MEDNALMARVQAGDRDAFDALVQRHYADMLRLSEAIVHDAVLAQDAVQESFADLYAHRRLYRHDFAFSTYLSAVVRHKSIDQLRRQKRLPLPLEALCEAQLPAAAEDSPEARCIAQAFARGLAGLIDGLPVAHRRMIIGYALEGKSYRDIARDEGCTVAKVKVTLHRVRKALRRIKEEWN